MLTSYYESWGEDEWRVEMSADEDIAWAVWTCVPRCWREVWKICNPRLLVCRNCLLVYSLFIILQIFQDRWTLFILPKNNSRKKERSPPLDSLPIEILKFNFFYFYSLRLVWVYSKISSLLNSFCNFVDFSQEKSCDLILRTLLPLNRLIYETKDNVFYSN